MRTRLLYCQLGLLLTVLLSRCNAFQRHTSTVHGSILCLFATYNLDAFRYHLRLADFLARYHDVTVVGVLPIPSPYQHSNFKYVRLANANPGKTYEPSNRFMKLYYQWQQFAELGRYHAGLLDAHPPGTYNLVIVAYYLNLRHLMLAGCFNAPIILTTETPPSFVTNWEVGNPREEGYLTSEFVESRLISKSYLRRLINLIIDKFIEGLIGGGHEVFCLIHRTFNLHFNCRNIRMEDVRRNISLVFTNNHFTQGTIRPNVPTMVEIGGIQIPERRIPLPQHIADHINKAEHGVIYINLGKGNNCTDLPGELLDSLHDVLVESQRYVLWRWSHCSKPRQGSRILYTRWMPQNDILAQKKVKLFITHGSMSSLGEGQYHAVPMLGVTYSSELVGNVEFLAQYKLAERIDAYNTNTDEIRSKLFSMLNDQSYQERSALYSLLYRDRQLTPRETVLYWVNYVLRYKGTPHMRSPAAEMTQLQMLGLDFIIFTFSTIFLMWKFRGFLWCCLTGRIFVNFRKFLRLYLFGNDYEIVIDKYSNIRYDEAVVDEARECQIRPQTVRDPDAPRVVPVKTARQRKFAGRRKR
ncbi:UDP-glycosyltransferase UGT4-like isoform X2 [Bactrocera tryoni]|uniref:UDP-glycosyltransferase UGT4-like isoform X2 n=1 Tax=Bactrocera tryoni TaxID=59916 RepID=UPI001A9821E8|nr:UDP-glycosyltransferase UGT4-like isoform X2 [Bactrocera tryoni]